VGPLSAREHEIASLAASGLSNRQIARRAVVSERTVENHLYRAFIKLGISSRDELADAIVP
jgi:DNA-binding CsgD family transcriptional regulator